MRALKQEQLKLLYFPHLRTHPLGDSEKLNKADPWNQFKAQPFQSSSRQWTHYSTDCVNSPELVQTCFAQKQILPHCLYCLRHFLN